MSMVPDHSRPRKTKRAPIPDTSLPPPTPRPAPVVQAAPPPAERSRPVETPVTVRPAARQEHSPPPRPAPLPAVADRPPETSYCSPRRGGPRRFRNLLVLGALVGLGYWAFTERLWERSWLTFSAVEAPPPHTLAEPEVPRVESADSAAQVSVAEAVPNALDIPQHDDERTYRRTSPASVTTDDTGPETTVVDAATAEAREALDAGDYARAAELFSTAIVEQGETATRYDGRGRARILNGQFTSGIADLEKAVALDRDHLAAHYHLAWNLATAEDESQRDLTAAAAHARRAAEISHWRNAEVLLMLAIVHSEWDELTEAKRYAEQAAALKPDDQSLQRDAAAVIRSVEERWSGQTDPVVATSLAAAPPVVQVPPSASPAHERLADAADGSAAESDAKPASTAQHERTPPDSPPQGRERVEPQQQPLWYERAEQLAEAGRFREAIELYDEAIQRDPSNPTDYYVRGVFKHRHGDFSAALKDLDEAIARNAKFAEAYVSRARLFADRGAYVEALNDFDQALLCNPANADTYNAAAWLLATCQDSDVRDGAAAVPMAQEACRLSSWQDHVYLDTLAAAHAADGDFEQAINAQKLALQHVPSGHPNEREYRERRKLYEQGRPFVDDAE